MRAYYYDNLPGDQRLPHDSSRAVPPKVLEAIRVQSRVIPVDGYEAAVAAVAREEQYQNHDIICISKEGLGDVSSRLFGL